MQTYIDVRGSPVLSIFIADGFRKLCCAKRPYKNNIKMFRIESYITPIVLSYIDKYVKDFKPQDAQVNDRF